MNREFFRSQESGGASQNERLQYHFYCQTDIKNLEVKALYLLMYQDLRIINTVFMPGQKKGKKFMVSKRENEVKEKI